MNNEPVSHEEFEALKRLVDGVKDAVLMMAQWDGPPAFRKACDLIAKAQQPPATATGVDATDANTSVGIDPAASAAAETNARATEGQRIGLYEPIHPCPTEETIP